MAGAIMGTKYVLQGSGAEVVGHTATETFYYGAGQDSRDAYAQAQKDIKASWLKAPYVDPNAAPADDY